MKKCVVIFILFLTACNFEADRLVPEETEEAPSPSASESPASTEPTLFSVAISTGPTVYVGVGQSKTLYLNVSLSDGSVYRGITKTFNTSHDDLDMDVIWYSNDENIATVSSSGKITAVAVGTTFVQANLGNKSVQVEVHVSDVEVILTSISFSDSTIESADGDSGQLTLEAHYSNGDYLEDLSVTQFKALEDCDLSFSSSDEDVALVYQNGVFYPVQNGSTTLLVSCDDLEAEASLVVTGIAAATETETEIVDVINSVVIDLDQGEYEMGEERTLTCDLSFDTGTVGSVNDAFVFPSGGVGRVEWQSSDEDVISIIEDGNHVVKIRFNSYGNATVTATYADENDEVVLASKKARAEPSSADDYFISSDDVCDDHFSADGGYGSASFPEIIYGMPDDSLLDVVSFGTGGELTIQLNGYVIVDGVGDDFTIFENPFDNWFEAAQVAVSDDGVTYHDFPCDAFGSGDGCAGVHVINYSSNPDDMRDPELSGGDIFDLADVGLEQVMYVKITDQETCVEDGYVCTSDTIGFDLDAFVVVNGENE